MSDRLPMGRGGASSFMPVLQPQDAQMHYLRGTVYPPNKRRKKLLRFGGIGTPADAGVAMAGPTAAGGVGPARAGSSVWISDSLASAPMASPPLLTATACGGAEPPR